MKSVFPKNPQSLPVAKRNNCGQIITNPETLKKLYMETYSQRLRHRPIKEEFVDLKHLKETLFSLRLKLSKLTKSKPWSESQLDNVLKNLKKNKSRDPHGLINDLFKPGVIGSNLKDSLLLLVNDIKHCCQFPEFIQWANITSLYKGKGEMLDLDNERGIFIVTVVRSILMRLIYNEKYTVIDSNMSDSNVGARRNKNIRNHIFVINGIIHEVLASKKNKSIDIQIMDYRQCFDSMWLQETINDMYEAGVKDDHLALLYEANKEVNVAIKTPNGLTDRFRMKEIILQGDVFGPIQCSVTVDSFGKECLKEEKHLYYYKDEVPIPLLTMVDDALAVTECGNKAIMMNAFLNTKTNIKKLQYGVNKCYKMHVGKTCIDEICPDLYVDGWRLKTVSEVDTGNCSVEEEHAGMQEMEEVKSEKYLGDILASDGRNLKNITARKNRGIGIVNKIMEKLNDVCFGRHYFKVAVILRNSNLISSLLTNSEAWYNVTKGDIEMLESVDEDLLRRILECPLSTPKEMLYLELGILPIRYIIKMRRLNFLQYMLHEEKESLVHKFLKCQLENPTNGDWGQSCHEALESLEINLKIEDIEKMKKSTFKNIVRKKTAGRALEDLNSIKARHSKVLHIVHRKLAIQSYLVGTDASTLESKFLFALRCRMVDLKANFRNKYGDNICPCCQDNEDTQEHLLHCEMLQEKSSLVETLPIYQDLFCENMGKQVRICRTIKKKFEIRKQITTSNSGPSDPYILWSAVAMYY